jgi:hypothetical protein
LASAGIYKMIDTIAQPPHRFDAAASALAAWACDIDDLRLLARIAGIETAGEALAVVSEFYPDEPVPARSAAIRCELFS